LLRKNPPRQKKKNAPQEKNLNFTYYQSGASICGANAPRQKTKTSPTVKAANTKVAAGKFLGEALALAKDPEL